MHHQSKTIVALAVFFCILCFGVVSRTAAEKAPSSKAAEPSKAKLIDAGTGLGTNHPEYEEGLSCNDCHEIKLDAATSATQVWLSGESPGRKAGEGLMPRERVWQEVVRLVGGIKLESKTFVLGTCMNNTPLTTTAEFTLDPAQKVLYGFHEMGTEKLAHIKNNPKVSLNWHQEFESFSDFRCCQIRGQAELLDGSSPEFEKIMIDFLPYEAGARVPPDATPQQREERLKGFRESLKKGFVITRITIDMATLASIDFTKDGFRRYQRWTR